MGKYSTVGRGGQYNVPAIAPTGVNLGEELRKQGLEVPPSALDQGVPPSELAAPEQGVPPQSAVDYARANAMAQIPQNTYSQQSSGMGTFEQAPQEQAQQQGPVTSDESMWDDTTNQARYPDEGAPQMDMMNARGMPMDVNQANQLLERNKREQALKARGLNIDWYDEASLEAAYPKSVAPTQRGTINRAARSISDSLLTTQAEVGTTENGMAPFKMSAMQNVKQGLGISAVKAGSLAATAFATVAPVLAGASDSVEGEITDQDSQQLHAWGSDFEGADVQPVALKAVSGGLSADTLYGLLGNSAMKSYQMGNVDKNGNALQPKQTNISTRVLGATLAQALVDKGYLVSDKTSGEEVFRLHPDQGLKFYQAARNMSREIGDLSRGRSQTVPVTDTGEYVGAARSFREGDKSKPNARATKQMREVKRISGSIATLTSPIKSFFAALFTNQAINEIYPVPANAQQGQGGNPNHPRSAVGQPIQGMVSTKALLGFSESDDEMSLKTKSSILTKLNNYYGQNIAEGAPRYAKHWEDYSVHRMYNDSEDINAQRDLMTRAVISSVSAPANFSGTNWHLTGIPLSQAEKHFADIGAKVRSHNMELTPEQREFAWVVTMGKVLEVGDKVGRETSSLTVPGIASLVTPEFLAQAAVIGATLSSIVPQSNSAIAAVNLDMKKIQMQLTPQQLGVLNNFINSSNSKDWGYRLQAYMDANNYLNAKKNGLAFTPRATCEIDMSSAGRTTIANDDGDIEVLSRVGILYNENQGGGLVNTLPQGNPRAFFLEVAVKQGIGKAISKDRPELAEAWSNLLDANMRGKFADDFGKGVLLQTDYGKPKSYHYDTARKFFSKHPSFRDAMLAYYPGDGGFKAMVKDLNTIYGSTLSATIDAWQQQLPKDITAVLGMVNKVPSPNGFWDEPMSIGSYMPKEDGSYTTLRSASGNTVNIPGTKRTVDPMAPARPKTVMDEETGEQKLLVPGPGSAAMNQVGPIMGQYRESILAGETMIHVNGGKAPADMLFMHSVFDNFILSSDSLLQTMYAANNILLPKVLAWDLRGNFVKDFSKKMAKALDEFKGQTEVVIGKNGPYAGITAAIDRQYGYLKENESKGWNISPAQREFINYIESPASGYVINKEGRSDNLTIPAAKAVSLVRAFMNVTMYSKGEGKERKFLPDVWANQGATNKKAHENAIATRAKNGKIYFMF